MMDENINDSRISYNNSTFNKSGKNILNITKNPFNETDEKVNLPVFSPGLLTILDTPKTNSFKWNIEQISLIKPCDFSTTNVFQEDSFPHMTRYDSAEVQSKVDEYFANVFLPSPFIELTKNNVLPSYGSDNCFSDSSHVNVSVPIAEANHSEKFMKNVECQTFLSFPPDSDIDTLLELHNQNYSTSMLKHIQSNKVLNKENIPLTNEIDHHYFEKNKSLFFVDIKPLNVLNSSDNNYYKSPIRLATPLKKSHESMAFNFSPYDISPIMCKSKKIASESKLLHENCNLSICTPNSEISDKTATKFTFNLKISNNNNNISGTNRLLEESPCIKRYNTKFRRNLSQNEILKESNVE